MPKNAVILLKTSMQTKSSLENNMGMLRRQGNFEERIKIQRLFLLVGFCLLYAVWLSIGARESSNLPLNLQKKEMIHSASKLYTFESIRKIDHEGNTFEVTGTIKQPKEESKHEHQKIPFNNVRDYKVINTSSTKNNIHITSFHAIFEGVAFDFRRFPYERGEFKIILNNDKESNNDKFMLYIKEDALPGGLKIVNIKNTLNDRDPKAEINRQFMILVSQYNHARFIRFMIPLLAVITISIAGLLISPKNYETRMGLPASAILILVFLQDRYRDLLPPGLDHTVLMDNLYIICFIVIISIFMETVSTGNRYLHSNSDRGSFIADSLLDSGRRYAIFILYALISIGLII